MTGKEERLKFENSYSRGIMNVRGIRWRGWGWEAIGRFKGKGVKVGL
jgi:hypothetical protein